MTGTSRRYARTPRGFLASTSALSTQVIRSPGGLPGPRGRIPSRFLVAGAVTITHYLPDIERFLSAMRHPDGCVVTLRNVTHDSAAEHGTSSTATVVAKLQVLRVALLDSPVCLLRFRFATASETDSTGPRRAVVGRGAVGTADAHGQEYDAEADVAGSVGSGGRDDDDSTGAREAGAADSDEGSVGSSTPLVPSSARRGGGKSKKPSSSSLAAAAETDIVGCPMTGKPPLVGSKHVRFASSDRGGPLSSLSYKGTPRAWPGASQSAVGGAMDVPHAAPLGPTSAVPLDGDDESRSRLRLHPPPRIVAPTAAQVATDNSDEHASPPPAVIVSSRSPLATAAKPPPASSVPGASQDGMRRAGSLRYLGRRNSGNIDGGAAGSVAHSSVGSSRATSRAQNMRSSIAAHANKLEETLVTLKRTIGVVFCLAAFLSIASLVTAQLLFGQVRHVNCGDGGVLQRAAGCGILKAVLWSPCRLTRFSSSSCQTAIAWCSSRVLIAVALT